MALLMADPARYAPDLLGFYPQERQIDRRYEVTGVNPYAMNADRYASGLLTDPMARAEFGTGLLQGATTDLGGTPVDVYAGAVDVAQAITPQNNQFNYYTNPFWMLSQSGDIAQKVQSVAGSEALGEAVYGKPEQGYEMYRDPARLIGGVTGAGELALGKVSKEVAPYVARGVNYLTDAMPRPQAVTPEGLLMDVPQQAPTQPQTLLMEGDSVPSATQTVDNVPIAEPAQVVPPTDENPVGIIAFHGSGADFDEFKLEKIGTGEGAQAYGYGLYFTDSEDIAKFYRDAIGGSGYKKIDYSSDTHAAKSIPDIDHKEVDGYKSYRIDQANDVIKSALKMQRFNVDPDENALNIFEMTFERDGALQIDMRDGTSVSLLKNFEGDSFTVTPLKKAEGKTYKVALEPKSEELLDYDKPIGNQSEDIKAKISKLVENEITPDDLENFGMPKGDLKASLLSENRSVISFLNDFAAIRGKDNAGEELLNKYGIKGLKYKAAGSRGAGVDDVAAERNYVIFDDKLIKIMEKYGIPAGVSVTAVKGAMQDTDDGLLAKDGQQPKGLL